MAKPKPKTRARSQTVATRRIFSYLSIIAAVLFFIVACVGFWAHNFIRNMVSHELSVQKIYFPEKGNPALNPEKYPGLQQYAGQLVDTPAKAKAYANEYIAIHLESIAEGKTYSEVSAAAQKDPTNEMLQKQRASLFQGEMLRGILLTSGYGFGTIGIAAGIVSFIALGVSLLLVLIAIGLCWSVHKPRN